MNIFAHRKKIKINKEDLNDAKNSSSSFENLVVQKRAFLNVLGVRVLINTLFKEKVDASNFNSLYIINTIREKLDISDIYYNDLQIDVRPIFNEEEIFIPKSHKKYGIEPDIYTFVKFDSEFENAEILGYCTPDVIDEKLENDNYYFVDKSVLTNPKNLKNYFNKIKHKDTQADNILTQDEAECLFLKLIDKQINENEFEKLIYSLYCDISLRSRLSHFENFEFIAFNTSNNDVLKNDDVLNIVGAQDNFKEETEEETLEEALSNDATKTSDEIMEEIINNDSPEELEESSNSDVEEISDEISLDDSSDVVSTDEEPFVDDVLDDSADEISLDNSSDEISLDDCSDVVSTDEEPFVDDVLDDSSDEISLDNSSDEVSLDDSSDVVSTNEEPFVDDVLDDSADEVSLDNTSDEVSLDDSSDVVSTDEEPFVDEVLDDSADEISLDNSSDEVSLDDSSDVVSLEDFDNNFEFGSLDDFLDDNNNEDSFKLNISDNDFQIKQDGSLSLSILDDIGTLDIKGDLLLNETSKLDNINIQEDEPEKRLPQEVFEYSFVMDNTSTEEETKQENSTQTDLDNNEIADLSMLDDLDDNNINEKEVKTEDSKPEAKNETQQENNTNQTTQASKTNKPITPNVPQVNLTSEVKSTENKKVVNLDKIVENSVNSDENKKKKNVLTTIFRQHNIKTKEKETKPQEETLTVKNIVTVTTAICLLFTSLVVLGTFIGIKLSDSVKQKTTENPKAETEEIETEPTNEEIVQGPLTEPITAKISNLSWEVPESIAYNDIIREYLQLAGKNLKLNLQNDLLLSQEYVYSEKVVIDLQLMKSGDASNINISTSSGSKSIDETIIRTVQDTLKYLKAPTDEITENTSLSLVISF